MKRARLLLSVLLLCCAEFCGCKPKEIHGQVFIVTQGRENIKLGAVKVMLVRRNDAIAALKESQAALEKKLSDLNHAADVLRSAMADINWLSFKTNTKYVAVSIQKSNALERITKLNEQAGELYSRNNELREAAYGSVDASQEMYRLELLLLLTKANTLFRSGSLLPINSNPPAGEPAAVKAWRSFLESINHDYPQLKAQIDGTQSYITNCDVQLAEIEKSEQDKDNARAEEAKKKLKQTEQSIQALKSDPSSYFEGFSPNLVEKAITDADGNFSLLVPRSGSYLIYAKAERMIPAGGSEKYFWLLSLQPKSASTRVILANDNLFEADKEWANFRTSQR